MFDFSNKRQAVTVQATPYLDRVWKDWSNGAWVVVGGGSSSSLNVLWWRVSEFHIHKVRLCSSGSKFGGSCSQLHYLELEVMAARRLLWGSRTSQNLLLRHLATCMAMTVH